MSWYYRQSFSAIPAQKRQVFWVFFFCFYSRCKRMFGNQRSSSFMVLLLLKFCQPTWKTISLALWSLKYSVMHITIQNLSIIGSLVMVKNSGMIVIKIQGQWRALVQGRRLSRLQRSATSSTVCIIYVLFHKTINFISIIFSEEILIVTD